MDDIAFPARLTAAVPTELAEAVRVTADRRSISAADYVRGAVQARLMLDGVPFRQLPNLQRVTARGRGVRQL